jgi:hypothetical protein
MGRTNQADSDPQINIITEREIPASKRPEKIGNSVDDVTPISAEGFSSLAVRKRILHQLILRTTSAKPGEIVPVCQPLHDAIQFLHSKRYERLRNLIRDLKGGRYYGALLVLEERILNLKPLEGETTLSEETQLLIHDLLNILKQTGILEGDVTATCFWTNIVTDKQKD